MRTMLQHHTTAQSRKSIQARLLMLLTGLPIYFALGAANGMVDQLILMEMQPSAGELVVMLLRRHLAALVLSDSMILARITSSWI